MIRVVLKLAYLHFEENQILHMEYGLTKYL